jgi:hypothetical protein
MRYVARIITVAAMVATAPLRAEPPSSSGKAQSAPLDPNQRICENITQTGSRLATKRFCGTRAEWDAKQKQDREVIEGAQRSANGPCSAVLTHSGAPNCG